MKARTFEAFPKTYGIIHPAEQWALATATCGSRRCTRASEALGAVFYEAAGWERPQWYEANAPLVERYGVEPREARVGRALVVADHQRRAPRDARARRALRPLGVRDLRRRRAPARSTRCSAPCSRRWTSPVGRVVYTPVLAPGRRLPLRPHDHAARRRGFRIVTGGAHGMADRKLFADLLPDDGSATLVDVTTAWTTIGLWGPRARDILASVTRRRRLARGLPVRHAAGRSRSARSSCSPRGSRTSATSAGSSTSRSSRARGSGTRCGRPARRTPDRLRDRRLRHDRPAREVLPRLRRRARERVHRRRGRHGSGRRSRSRTSSARRRTCATARRSRRRCSARSRSTTTPRRAASSATRSGASRSRCATGRRSPTRRDAARTSRAPGAGPSLGKYLLLAYLPPEHAVEGSHRARGRVHDRALPGDRRASSASTPDLRPARTTRIRLREDPRLRQARADDGRADRRSPTTRRRSRRGTSASRSARTRSAASRRRCGSSRRTAASRSCSRSARRRRWSSCATRWRSASTARIHLVTDGEEWDPQATAAAIVDAIRADEAATARSTWSSSATRPPTRAATRSGSASRTRSGARSPPGSRASPSTAASCAASRRSAGGRDVYELPLPAVVTVLEGLNLPRYPSVPGRLRAQRKPRRPRRRPTRPAPRLEKLRLVVPEGEAKQAEILGEGAERCAARGRGAARRSASLVTRPRLPRARRRRGRRARRCRRSRFAALARRRAPVDAVVRLCRSVTSGVGDARGHGVATLHVAEHDVVRRRSRRDAIARGDRRACAERIGATRRSSGRGRERGQRGAGARRGPCSTCRSRRTASRRRPATPVRDVTRVRWGGSLLEEARARTARRPLLTVQPHAVAVETTGDGAPAGRDVHARARRRRPASLRVVDRVGAGERRRLARRREGRRLGRSRGRLGGGLRGRRGARGACSAARSAAPAR